MPETLVIVDSRNLCYRAHWVHKFLQSRGRPTSVLYGALKMVAAVAHRMPDTAFVFAWDGKGKTWRHELTKGVYKANRKEPNPDFLPCFEQIPMLRKVLVAAGFREFDFANLEADDLIGILSAAVIEKGLFKKVVIYSTDKDFYQLATNQVGILRAYDKDKPEQVMYAREVMQESGLSPRDWVKVRALTGDVTDNIPKIQYGLGPKTAIGMIQAGLDPSVEHFKNLTWSTRQNFGLLVTQWKKIRQNYVLSEILTSWDNSNLLEETKAGLKLMVEGLTKESLLKDRKRLTDESFSDFTEFISEYELNDLFADRHLLWRMP